jgi:hypothetical protein
MIDRREFVQSALATAAAGVLAPGGKGAAAPRPRVAVLLEPDFPAVDAPPPRREELGAALEPFDVTWLGAADLAALSPHRFDVFVSPCGSAFPKDAVPALLAHLGRGGNWVNLGGAPCTVLVTRDGAAWHPEARQFATSHRLGVTLACAVDAAAVQTWRGNPSLPWTSGLAAPDRATTVWEPYWRLSSVADTPDESGSAGPMEAVVEPLLSGLDADGRSVAVPLLLVDRVAGEFAGGRWIFATSDAAPTDATLRALVEACLTLCGHWIAAGPTRSSRKRWTRTGICSADAPWAMTVRSIARAASTMPARLAMAWLIELSCAPVSNTPMPATPSNSNGTSRRSSRATMPSRRK